MEALALEWAEIGIGPAKFNASPGNRQTRIPQAL
jgi:hypothetical protein